MVMNANIFADISIRAVLVGFINSIKLKMEKIKMFNDRIIKGILILFKGFLFIIIATADGA